ncbi:MAG: ergothioneine biosynthesis protein EgtC [Thermosynechococcaceae cyanobacterium]
MCRLLGYLGPPVRLDALLLKPEHSLIVQSYQPQEMTAGLLNADGFGLGWYHPEQSIAPCTYRNTTPIWSDQNLTNLAHYVESGCVVAYVRSATVGQSVQLSNCQPYGQDRLLGIHNGFIDNFRQTLYRQLRNYLSDRQYQAIEGTTDSEHIFALVCHQLEINPALSLQDALIATLKQITIWAVAANTSATLNVVLSDGQSLVASRYACLTQSPSLYWVRDELSLPGGVLIASERMFESNHWNVVPENSLLIVTPDREVYTEAI